MYVNLLFSHLLKVPCRKNLLEPNSSNWFIPWHLYPFPCNTMGLLGNCSNFTMLRIVSQGWCYMLIILLVFYCKLNTGFNPFNFSTNVMFHFKKKVDGVIKTRYVNECNQLIWREYVQNVNNNRQIWMLHNSAYFGLFLSCQ